MAGRESQEDVTAYLKTHASSGPSRANKVIETHAALIFLHAKEALKIKRAVRYDYLDATTLDRRAAMLRRELELNAPAAPGLYRDVVPITRQANDGLAIDGDGVPVEWLLRMTRFPVEAELSVMADKGQIDAPLAEALGAAVARYHRDAPRTELSGATLIAEIIVELDRALSDMTDRLGRAPVARFLDAARWRHDAVKALLLERTDAGWVRRCHGDLHLHNLVMWRGVPTPFDALEFDERLGTCDLLYDLAFLLMDLSHRGLDLAANRVLNTYLRVSGDADHLTGLAAMPLFLAIRAAIRAMVNIQTASFVDDRAHLIADGRACLALANRFLAPPAPRLVAIGGLSGSGKTTIGHCIAPSLGAFPGAVHLSSDTERKARFGVDPATRLPSTAYAADVSARVYDTLRAKARLAIEAGHSVILDAVHADREDRARAERIAADLGCAFSGLWLESAAQTRVDRIAARPKGASDADATVARSQTAINVGDITWPRLETKGTAEDCAARALQKIGI